MSYNHSYVRERSRSPVLSSQTSFKSILSKKSQLPQPHVLKNFHNEPRIETRISPDHFASDDALAWSGFLSRSKKHRVGVDAYILKGNFDFPNSMYRIDIQFRSPIPQGVQFNAIMILAASNETQSQSFKTYIDYFSNKNRAGYVPIGKQNLYIIPPGDYARSICPSLRENEMLGVLLDFPYEEALYNN